MISFNFFVLKPCIDSLLFLPCETKNRLKRIVFHNFVAQFVVGLGCKQSGGEKQETMPL